MHWSSLLIGALIGVILGAVYGFFQGVWYGQEREYRAQMAARGIVPLEEED